VVSLSLSKTGAEVFVPDGIEAAQALSRTTHLGVGAHPDDLEIMAIHGISTCFDSSEQWFTGVVATDGAGSHTPVGSSPESARGLARRRRGEQKRAAELGRDGALVLLDHASAEVKNPKEASLVGDLSTVLRATSPEVVYTHNLADAHDTHVAVALALIAACRSLDDSERPRTVIGCEVWRDLDWLASDSKVALPVGDREDLEAELIRAFESQLEAGKRYDLAAIGRRRANATFHEIRRADGHPGIVWGMDLGPAIRGEMEPGDLVKLHVRAFEDDVANKIRRFTR
jgi:LmbE family N-acetylglucosaminyl deacetylase